MIEAMHSTPQMVLALAPEGQDDRSGKLGAPPPGGGRFLLHLNRLGLRIFPAGAYESSGRFCLRFGPAFELDTPAGGSKEEQDQNCSRQVMQAIAALLPPELLPAGAT